MNGTLQLCLDDGEGDRVGEQHFAAHEDQSVALLLSALAPFFERFIKPVEASAARGRDGSLSSALHNYLGSAAVNERTDDDKTLVIATRRVLDNEPEADIP